LALISATLLFSPQMVLAQFSQQGPKLVDTLAVGTAVQGFSVALAADGNTAIVGGLEDNSGAGAAWVFTRSGGVWSQQGSKLVGTGGVAAAAQYGTSVALSADGNTAIVGGWTDNSATGAAWVFTRSGGVWTQQGSKLVANDAAGIPRQGTSVALSADGNTAIVGGLGDSSGIGAVWVFTRSGGVWTQQGSKLVGTGAVGTAQQGTSVALSADGNTVIVGGPYDNSNDGAAWVFTRSGGVWSQQGSKLVGTGAVGVGAQQGWSVALSADGNTAIMGGNHDNSNIGAAWVFTRSGGVWTQQGTKLVGTGAVGTAVQGFSVALAADRNTAIVGGYVDNSNTGAAWVFTGSGGVWSQQGSKLVGTGAVGGANQGYSVALSADGNTAIVGGPNDNSGIGATWAFVQPALQITPATNIVATGTTQKGGFSPTSFNYQLTSTSGSVDFSISGIPSWLNASFTSGAATTSPITVTFSLINVGKLRPGTYNATITFTNTTNGQGNTTQTATLTVLKERDD
jgi:hypothetical protein